MRILLVLLLIVPNALSAETRVVREVLVGEREPLLRPSMEADRIERAMARGDWQPPQANATDQDGMIWKRVVADEDGWIRDESLRSGYAYGTLTLEEEGTYLLEAMGYAGVSVNGEPRIGNVYGYTDDWEPWQPAFDYSLIPVRLKKGDNHFLFFGSRYGLLRARFHPADSPLSLNPRDATLPDLVVGERVDTWGAIVVLNATEKLVAQAKLEISIEGEAEQRKEVATIDVPPIPPLGVRKVGFPIRAGASNVTGVRGLRARLILGEKVVDDAALELQVREPDANRRVTFVSAIDGSVQFYGYLPARDGKKDSERQARDRTQNQARDQAQDPVRGGTRDRAMDRTQDHDRGPMGEGEAKALILSLHGAGVDALNQSGSYAPLSWGHVLAPTNRRPYGFNWEDWGRLDALEVLELGLQRLRIDPDRVYLTGHSMGGHGSWHVGSLHPDRFAAVGPSAGWISLWSYRMDELPRPLSPLTALVERANLPSRTLELAPNLEGLGIYVLHGAEDDNVPTAQSALMLERLEEFHRDFVYHEQPGVGHWWDLSEEPGADCVAWAPMFDFFSRHRRPRHDEVREIRFVTPSARISAWNRWVCVAAQQRPFVMSRVALRLDPLSRHVGGTTENVATLGLDLAGAGLDSVRLDLDGETLTLAVPSTGTVWLSRRGSWVQVAARDLSAKGMHRDGSFREAFGNRMQLVHGTRGSAAENAWALAKARYDAEYFWYQGNAAVDVLPDSLFDPAAASERNVVLYGNADTHAHWKELWDAANVQVERGRIRIGGRELSGEGLAVLAVQPRPESARAMVGIVSGTGLAGFRLLDRRPYLIAGVAYPDLTVFEDRGDKDIVRAAGFFGNDWSLESGEFLWADAP